jgi:acetylornithine/N-succinyldiaminopimelate aminotransferase
VIPALMPTYERSELVVERGEGAYLFDTNGKRYLDFCAGIAVSALGHGHPHLIAALKKQAEKIWHCSNVYQIPGGTRLAERLVAATFADSVFFGNSGAEAVECGLKMIRKYYDDIGEPNRYRVICCDGSFHGRTFATIAAGGSEKLTKGFEPNLEGFDHVPFGNLNATRAAIGSATAAILVEPIQGEGGIQSASKEYLEGLREIADEFGLLLFFDEVQCGMGRTGKLFAHEWAGVTPDIMSVAKGLGGGFPIGACLGTEKCARALTPGSHGSTFGGNPLAMAVANAVLDVMLEDGFLAEVHDVAKVLHKELAGVVHRHPKVVAEVRGVGLLAGLRCVPETTDNKNFQIKLREFGLLTIGGGDNVARLLPPLTITSAHVDEAIAILDRTCEAFEAG